MRNLIVLGSLLLLWQAIVMLFDLPPYILPTPLEVSRIGAQQFHLIYQQSLVTFFEIILGFCLGILFGSTAAILMGFFRPVSWWLFPILIITQAMPTFAIAPLLVIWFGYGIASKIIMIILMIFFPVTSAFYDGLKRTNPDWIELATIMNAKKWQVFRQIRIPAALPSLASGIRLAAVAAPIGAIVGEWVGASKGLGYLMLNANARMQIDLMFATMFVIIIFSLVLYYTVNKLLKILIPWSNA